MQLKQGLFRPPRFRSVSAEGGERHATWTELFGDLAFVAVIGQLTASLAADLSWFGLLRFAILFTPVFWAWVGGVFYLSRFDTDDAGHRLLSLLQIALTVVLAVGVPSAFDGAPTIFIFAYTGLRLLLSCNYILAGANNPEVRALTSAYAGGFGTSALLWPCTLLLPPFWQPLAWLWLVFIELAIPALSRQLGAKFPPHPGHVPERFGLMTLIVLGEAILATVGATSGRPATVLGWVIGITSLLLAFSIWWLYFEGVRGADAKRILPGRGIVKFQVWMYGHLPLFASMVIMAACVKKGILLPTGAAYPPVAAAALVGGAWLCMICFHMIYEAGLEARPTPEMRSITLPHWIVTLSAPLVGWALSGLPAPALIGGMAGLMAIHALLTTRDLPGMPAYSAALPLRED